jgi:hypothetical protein
MNNFNFNTNKRGSLEKAIVGALRSTIHAHGDISKERIGSATKRIYYALKQWDKLNKNKIETSITWTI